MCVILGANESNWTELSKCAETSLQSQSSLCPQNADCKYICADLILKRIVWEETFHFPGLLYIHLLHGRTFIFFPKFCSQFLFFFLCADLQDT